MLDLRNGNTKWQDSTSLEMEQLHEYQTFKDLGKSSITPNGFKRIRVHLVFDIKHDGRHKSRLVADGHLTEVPLESVYSGVVSLRGLRLVVFLAELNDLDIWATNIGNAYLEAETQEKVFIIAGPEFVKIFIMASFSNAMNPREILPVLNLRRTSVPSPYTRSHSVSLGLPRLGQT